MTDSSEPLSLQSQSGTALPKPAPRPFGISLLALLNFLSATLGLIAILKFRDMPGVQEYNFFELLSGFILTTARGIGLWNRTRWGWWLAILTYSAHFLDRILGITESLPSWRILLNICLACIILGYLATTRRLFVLDMAGLPKRLTEHRITAVILVLVVLPVLALDGYRYRCAVIRCPPADWSTTYAEVTSLMAWLKPDYRIDKIRARPVDGAQIAADGSVDMRITAEFVSTKAWSAPRGEYAAEHLIFNDRDRWFRWEGRDIMSPEPSNPEIPLRFARVRFTPRDALKTTWPLALGALPEVRTGRVYLALVASDAIQEEFGVESVWEIHYDTDETRTEIVYWVDAQTGQILRVET